MTQLSYLTHPYQRGVPEDAAITRRATLAGVATGTTALTGCLGRISNAWDRDSPSQISVEILTLPEDEDIHALRIARHLAENLEAAGVQADTAPTRHTSFLREILINHDFDLYVWRHPGQTDPDALRALLHSQYAQERGWQNPYGFSNSIVDELLEEQRRGHNREGQLADLQEVLADERPFIPIAFEEEQRLMREDRIASIGPEPFEEPIWLYELTPVDDVDQLRLGTTDWRLTHNLNPIAVEYRGRDNIMEVIYEPPARRYGGDLIPWLARGWRWVSPGNARIPTMELTLREGLAWHDGEPLTSDDVVFTYEFMRDTSMTEDDPNVPSPVYHGRLSLLDTVEAVDAATLRLQFHETTRALASRLLTVPLLPEHVWSEWTDLTEVAGIPVDEVTTDALVEENLDPVGSGPLRVEEVEADELLRLSRSDDHPFADPEEHPFEEIGPPAVEELIVEYRPSVSNITDAIVGGDLDGSLRGVGRALANEGSDEADVVEYTQQTSRLFHLGFNVRDSPLNNAGFRAAVEPLLDRLYIREEIFAGGARLTRTPVFDRELVPGSLQWTEGDVNRFAGEPGTGEVDVENARQGFRDAGFSYSEDGDLLAG